VDQTESSPAVGRFRLLSSKMKAQERSAASAANGAVTQLAAQMLLGLAMSVHLTSGPVGRPPTAVSHWPKTCLQLQHLRLTLSARFHSAACRLLDGVITE